MTTYTFGTEGFGEGPFGGGTVGPPPPREYPSAEWAVVLNGVYLSGGDGTTPAPGCQDLGLPMGCLSMPPDGMGLPEMRTEDVTFPQRDGVTHYGDWYNPRIITLENVSVCADGCPGCPSAREKVQRILRAWSRHCDDVELVIFTDCHGQGERSVVGPYGIKGRPRLAEVKWYGQGSSCASLTLRFDAVDHRMYILDECGTPGSGGQCVTLTPAISYSARCYDRCYTPVTTTDSEGNVLTTAPQWCYEEKESGGGPQTVTVAGTESVHPTIKMCGTLTNPVFENLTNGETVGITGTVVAGGCITINTENGTATDQTGANRTFRLNGNSRLRLEPGENLVRLRSYARSDTGNAEVCFRASTVIG